VLCGVSSASMSRPDDLSGRSESEQNDKNISSLDKFTMQEKVVPLLKGIKTKEPAVMLAALKVFRQVGQAADAEFLATEVLPVLWTFALGPLLDLAQFRSFMHVIKAISGKIEKEQVRKLQELGTGRPSDSRSASTSAPISNGLAEAASTQANGNEDDFAKLVLGSKTASTRNDPFAGALSDGERLTQNPPTFSWSSTNNAGAASQSQRAFTPNMTALQPQAPSRSVTPDVSAASFPSLQPSTSGSIWNQPATRPLQSPSYGVAAVASPSLASSQQRSGLASPPILPPPPSNPTFSNKAWQQPNYNIAPPPSAPVFAQPQQRPPQQNSLGVLQPQQRGVQQAVQPQKSGLDKYQSLL
jgi:SCY1-like protein 2